MQMNDFRTALAPMMGTTPDGLMSREKRVRSLMRAEAPDVPFGTGHAIEASPLNAGIVLVTELDRAKLHEMPERTARLWRARFAREGKTCPVTRAATVGQAIVALIEQPALRAKLDHLDLQREVETFHLWWRSGKCSTFHPFPPREWRKRVVEAAERGAIHTASLAGPVLGRVADLIVEHRGR